MVFNIYPHRSGRSVPLGAAMGKMVMNNSIRWWSGNLDPPVILHRSVTRWYLPDDRVDNGYEHHL